jgi:hypothetical protein
MRLFIVVRRYKGDRWKAAPDGEFESRRLAENFAECKRETDTAPFYEFAIVEGEVETPAHRETPQEAEARLGAF